MHLQIRATDYVYTSVRDLVRSATLASKYTRRQEDSALVIEGEMLNTKLAPDADVLRITRLQPSSTLASSLVLVEYPPDTNDYWEGPWVDRFIVELGNSLSTITTIRIQGLDWAINRPHEGVFDGASRFANVVELWFSDCRFLSVNNFARFVRTFPCLAKLHLRYVNYFNQSPFNSGSGPTCSYTPISEVGDLSGDDLRVWLSQAY